MERVQKIIAAAGVSSRRNAERLIEAGRVTVNDQVVAQLGTQADPEHDVIAVDGKPIRLPKRKRTFMLNKPAGYLSTRTDTHGRKTVFDLSPDVPGLHPIGRLDYDTTGLIFLTNDGALTYALTHPKHGVEKAYRAWVEGVPSREALDQLRHGITLDDGPTAPAKVQRLAAGQDRALLEVTIHEGRKRQVRRMLEAIGHPVQSLSRVRVGPVTLGELPEGQTRELTNAEVEALYEAAGIK